MLGFQPSLHRLKQLVSGYVQFKFDIRHTAFFVVQRHWISHEPDNERRDFYG
jgi:hypothetical protein